MKFIFRLFSNYFNLRSTAGALFVKKSVCFF